MPDIIHEFFFGVYPYIALAIMVIGSILRYDREPYSWRSGSSQLLRRRLDSVDGDVAALGELLDVPSSTLYRRLKKYELI